MEKLLTCNLHVNFFQQFKNYAEMLPKSCLSRYVLQIVLLL